MTRKTLFEEDAAAFYDSQFHNALQKLQQTFPSKPSGGCQQQFEFVEGLQGKAERKRARAFVTKQHYRKKKYENSEALRVSSSRSSRASASASLPKDFEATDERVQSTGDMERIAVEKVIKSHSGTQETPVIDHLGRGRIDPFNSYPIPATRDVHELVDHYYFVIPSLVHRHWHRAVRRPRSCWDLLNLYRKHETPFVGMLHHAALHLATLRGQQESLQSIEFKQRSLVAVNRSFQGLSGPCDDWTLMGVGLLANAERVWGDRQIARLHWGALKRLLLERGGFAVLQHNPPMHTKLVWSFIALSWPTMDGNPAYLDEHSESVGVSLGTSSEYTDSAYGRSCDEFVEFFNQRRAQALKNLPSTPAQQKTLRDHPYRTNTFKPGSELNNALSNTETGYDDPDKRRAVDNCRMASLIHLNLVMAEFGDFSATTIEYLKSLQLLVEDDDDDSDLSAEHLLWTLLSASTSAEHYDRVWKMSRLVGVVKRTSSQMWSIIENALRTFLRLPESAEDLELILREWDHKRFLLEAMSLTERLDPSTVVPTQTSRAAGVNMTLCSIHCQICPLKPATY
ncbi:hypothetical protein LTR72_010105 [Exophiala xenobiotica]|nr:hypothetical protein LTR41_008581 [Exophiala xenobiotica]KAK5217109.1 hypothetical protein LTR72_010105 [Exophiala xenobiotica]KAK5287772.1 hypothetical protein LTR14_009003 [Exophiala xenobiotica]KAK5318635.1 hypothetical protein LTR93_008030 [Exophiala xenobiotica]KAK5362439.1 hypothetical protein LTS13_009557 [Exophiala xenobiotica]